MNEYEEHVLSLAQELHDGLINMRMRGVISTANMPDDCNWLLAKLAEMSPAIAEMKEHNED